MHVYLWGMVCLLGMTASAHAADTSAPTDFSGIIRHVYENNPTINVARERYRGVQELYPQARAGWLPSINADGTNTKEASLTLDQPIFRGGRTTAEIKRANDLIAAAQAELRQAELNVLQDVMSAATDIAHDEKIVALLAENENALRQERDAAQERFSMGDVTHTDVKQAEVRLARATARKVDAIRNLDASRYAFQQVAGYKPPSSLTLPALVFSFPPTEEDMVTMAEEQNPSLTAARLEHMASTYDIEVAESEHYPQISAFASINRQYDPQPGIVDRSETDTIGLRARLNLYQGGAIQSRVRQAVSNSRQNERVIDETRDAIYRDVRRNRAAWMAAQTETHIRQTEITAAESALAGVREEARIGQRTILDILDADQEAIDARVGLVSAGRREAQARYALAAALGLLTPENMGVEGISR